MPIAALQALTANLSRDPKKTKPFTIADFTLFRDREEQGGPFRAEVAAVALELRHEDRTPRLLIVAWDAVLSSVKDNVTAPECRALCSDDSKVWVLAPSWENGNCRGGLVMVEGAVSGPMLLRDVDRQLLSYRLVVPKRPGLGWLEAELLLLSAET